ncbi:hypothetical protein [Nonomuraea sp. B5E05]|uniref:hypothetical protein n=1 Tax=Nonomuraea sp. B5E05 TaxID=3153569 RepID=UPI0032608DE5
MISASNTITPGAHRVGGLAKHARLLKKLAVVAATGLLALGIGVATASSASAGGPSGEISASPALGTLQK